MKSAWCPSLFVAVLAMPLALAQDDLPETGADSASVEGSAEPADTKTEAGPEDFAAFQKLLSGATLTGHFTMTGAPEGAAPEAESYVIKKVTQVGTTGRSWLFMTKLKMGRRELTVPLPIKVEWALKTPVITLDDFTIPGMGTFSARVLFDDGQYAGTWSHGKKGGHLYGVVEPAETTESKAAETGK